MIDLDDHGRREAIAFVSLQSPNSPSLSRLLLDAAVVSGLNNKFCLGDPKCSVLLSFVEPGCWLRTLTRCDWYPESVGARTP